MGIFGKKHASPPIGESAIAAAPQDLGVVIHVMPKDFLGAEAKLRVEPAPEKKIEVVPVVAPPVKPTQPLAPKSRVPIWMWALIAVLVLFILAAIGYVVLGRAQPQPVVAPVVEQVKPPVVQEVPVVPVVEAPREPELSKDSDSDGLSDIEERMYGTDYRNPDTDGDTFLDGNEVFHLYDPLGVAPSTLLDTGAVKVFTAEQFPFSVYYPTTWKVQADAANALVTFTSPNIVSIAATWSVKAEGATIEDWIVANVDDAELRTMQVSYTKQGYYTLRSADDLVAYIDIGGMVYVITYDLSSSKEISYTQTFAMMVNSLTIAP